MNAKNIRIIGIIAISFSIAIIYLSLILESEIMLFIGIFLVVVSSISTVFISALDVFRQDRILNRESLEKSGLHIVTCTKCEKENVLEDKFCVYCGEELNNDRS